MEYRIDRFSFDYKLIGSGILILDQINDTFKLTYIENQIVLSTDTSHYPLLALEQLRLDIENNYSSLLNCNGCRYDYPYRRIGDLFSPLCEKESFGDESFHLLSSTQDSLNLCKVADHIKFYKNWCVSRRMEQAINNPQNFTVSFRIRAVLKKVYDKLMRSFQ